jgi:hypothetical protein
MNAPQKSESPLAGGPIDEQMTGDEAIVGNTDAERKAYATPAARRALAGITLRRIGGCDGAPRDIVSRWARTRALASVYDVAAWLDRVMPTVGAGARREVVDAANRRQHQLAEAADLLRGPGGCAGP